VAKHPFLSDEWFAVVERLVAEHDPGAPPPVEMVLNLSITETPFGAERHLHVSTRGGNGRWGIGHAPDSDTTITTDYETARAVFVEGDVQAGINAFTTGKVRVQGDLSKLLGVFGTGGVGAGSALYEAIQGVTE
jgi:hypothetical protein